MKNCPRCHLPYPTDFSVCPRDGSVLQYLQEWQPGDVIREKYKITRKIGQGGMGAIYKAEHLIFEEPRALKVLMPELAHDDSLVRYLRQEARITRRLSHPNAVRTEDIDRAEDGRLFIAMEYVEGSSLKKIVQQSGPLPVPRVIEIARQLCSALDSAHSLGMIHRDIKPENVLLVPQPAGRDLVKLLDFGIAKIKESAKERGKEIAGVTMTKTGFVVGTPQYMSPEQAMGKPGDQLDGRSDLYSLGVLIYEALTGELPFHSDTPLGYIVHHVHTLPASPLERLPDVELAEPIVKIVMKALEKDPADRFQSAGEMSLALAAAAEAFERETVIKKAGTTRTQSPIPGTVPSPAHPLGGEDLLPTRAPTAEAAPTPPRTGSTVVADAGQSAETSEQSRKATPGERAALFPRTQMGRLLQLAKRKRVQLAVVVVLLAVTAGLMVTWWRRPGPAVRPIPAAPVEPRAGEPEPKPTLTADHDKVEKGEAVTLTWGTENATKVDLQPGVGAVQATGSTTVKPENSTTYTLTATGPGGTRIATVLVTVVVPPPVRPAPRPALSPTEKRKLTGDLAIANFHMDRGEYDEAIQAYREALKIDPSNRQAREGLRKALQLRGILKGASE